MPLAIRVDNGMPLGDPQRKSIPELSLWLLAKEINMIFNRPKQPTDNAKVERMQRTTGNWAEVKNAKSVKDLKAKLKAVCLIQRERFEVSRLGNKTRKETYPELMLNDRKYNAKAFEVTKAYDRLADWTLARKASSNSQIALYSMSYYLGIQHRNKTFNVKFNKESICWEVFDDQQVLIKSFKAYNLRPNSIRNLSVGQRT
ncbi:MAG: hypothetical protein KTR30_33205 [Saprospiraceae bacterium]|nr:hypothetical protein [Saprospiraceae bacterium]